MKKKRSLILVLVVAVMTVCLAVPAMASAAETDSAAVTAQEEDETSVNEPPVLDTTAVRATVLSAQSVKAAWSKVRGARNYTVSIKKGSGVVKKVTTKRTSCLVKKLTRGTRYTIVVKAVPKSDSYQASESSVSVKTPKKITREMKGFSKTNAGKMLKVAKSKLGYSYVSGGSGPTIFDCSGYVYYITKRAHKAGYTSKQLKRSSDAGELAQMRRMKGARYVGRSYSKAQPGDIVFLGGHVAFYYGDNKLIHATNPRVDVAITSIWWSGGPGRVVAIYRLPEM